MKNELERKFLVAELPDLTDLPKIEYERHFLFHDTGIELRVQRKGETFEVERKVSISDLERTREKLKITEAEFTLLKQLAIRSVIRYSYLISDVPNITIKVYHGDYAGLMRAEVEFDSVQELESFVPLSWFGAEITGTSLARDGELSKLSQESFTALLKELKG